MGSKILLISPDYSSRYNSVNEHLKTEIRRRYDVCAYGQRRPECGRGYHVPDLIDYYGKPDLILVWHLKHLDQLSGLRGLNIPKVLFVTDYPPEWQKKKNEAIFLHEFDLVLFSQRLFVDDANFARKNGMIHKDTKLSWLPFSINTALYNQGTRPARDLGVFMVCSDNSLVYPNRQLIMNKIKAMSYVKSTLGLPQKKSKRIVGSDYVNLIRRSKIAVASNGRFQSVNFKHLEYCAGGALLLTDKAKDFGAMGFIADRNMVIYETAPELKRKIKFYLDNEKDRARIAAAGKALVDTQHDVEVRCSELFKKLRDVLRINISPKESPVVTDQIDLIGVPPKESKKLPFKENLVVIRKNRAQRLKKKFNGPLCLRSFRIS